MRSARPVTSIRNGVLLSALAIVLSACGGGSAETPAASPAVPSTPSTPNQAPVTGVATPDSVAVVTATNVS